MHRFGRQSASAELSKVKVLAGTAGDFFETPREKEAP
jgi:hypothetical protein